MDPTPDADRSRRKWLDERLRERSLWEVLGVYLAGSWVAFEIVATLAETLALPAWVPRGLLVLIAIGVPVLFAAVLLRDRRGVPSLRLALMLGVVAFATLLGGAGLVTVFRTAPSGAASPDVTSLADGAYGDLADDPRPAIAVLPFADLSPEGDQGFFSDGISEEILQVLSKIRDLRVASRSSAFRYRDAGLDPKQLGEALGVPFLLDGSVRRDGDEVRISAELVSARDGFSLWSQTYDRRLDGVFAIQSEIAQAIADSLRVPLGIAPETLITPTLDVEAHDLYLNARAELRRRGAGLPRAIELFERAIARDSGWAPAWAGLAEAHAAFPLYPTRLGESTDSVFWAENLAAAERAARRALELDPRNAAARVALGSAHRDRWEWDAAETELREALAIDPDNVEAHVQYAEVLWGVGRLDEALRETGRALDLDKSPINYDVHGFVMYQNGRYEEAEALLEEGIAIDSTGDMHFLRTVLANLMLLDGRYREALERFTEYLPDPEAYRLMGEALESGDGSRLPESGPRGLAQAWMLLGEPERALDALERTAFALPFRVVYEVWDEYLVPLQSTRRFQETILPRLNLEGAVARYATAPD